MYSSKFEDLAVGVFTCLYAVQLLETVEAFGDARKADLRVDLNSTGIPHTFLLLCSYLPTNLYYSINCAP